MAERIFRAVIFDMDGVLADSEPTYLEAANVVLAPLGKHVSEEQNRLFIGTSVRNTWSRVKELLGLPGDLDEYVRQYDKVLVSLLSRPRPTLPGVRELLAELDRRGLPRALVTSSWQGWVNALLGAIGLTGTFPVVVTEEQVENAKPAPEPFLRAAALLGIEAAACIAIEDTPSGIQAARTAGMYAVQVRSASTAFSPIDGADLVLDSLEDFPLDLLALGPGPLRSTPSPGDW
ncbi:MAG: HAD family phosphatase [Candidatus Bathyarchaeota archaeon]|nr:HAD family phosphatase [Candidatus Bathyarchaeota archaeon]